MSIPYRFMPWTRSGLARAHSNADSNAPLAARPKVKVGLTLQAKQDGNPVPGLAGGIELALYGPGDIIGIDPRLVVRTDPKPNSTNFEPNYLAIIDFDPPDFPWLLTPAHANVNHQLRPWLVLVVVERSQVALPSLKPGAPLPSITLTAAQVATQLPNLDESWLWAHAQAVSQTQTAAALAAELPTQPAQNISRLVCPRRLEARKNYLACVVPAFDAGRRRGLGQPLLGDTLEPAWDHANPIDTELPVYTHWEFSTGPLGDIETLARRLQTPAQYQNDLPMWRNCATSASSRWRSMPSVCCSRAARRGRRCSRAQWCRSTSSRTRPTASSPTSLRACSTAATHWPPTARPSQTSCRRCRRRYTANTRPSATAASRVF
jgi:hypothetical protein